ncbi:MAG: AmmeMemoRadiSam system protein A [Deltaproteobacteria bacterium]|nr:AmmeMemoRadiSam system protein A [Deltaproteobacteria bacterium]
MERSCSPDGQPATAAQRGGRYSPAERVALLALARESIAQHLRTGKPLAVRLDDHPAPLREPQACFVTLYAHGSLRGCIGCLQARRPLVEEVAQTACSAAFQDPRFPPLIEAELAQVEISLSVLSDTEPLRFGSERDLVAQLRPHVDGLVLRDGLCSGTFLPIVWERYPEPAAFLRQLRMKAGLPADHWSDRLTVERYTTESFSEAVP